MEACRGRWEVRWASEQSSLVIRGLSGRTNASGDFVLERDHALDVRVYVSSQV